MDCKRDRTIETSDRLARCAVSLDFLNASVTAIGNVDQPASICSHFPWPIELRRTVAGSARTPHREQSMWEGGENFYLVISGVCHNQRTVGQNGQSTRVQKLAYLFSFAADAG